MEDQRERIVILGAGFGGLVAALDIARRDASKEVILVDKNDVHTYTPWLYEVVTGALRSKKAKDEHALHAAAGIAIRDVVKRSGRENLHFQQREVSGLDLEGKHVLCADGKALRYDRVILALGSVPNDFGIPGVARYGISLASLDGALAVRERITEALAKKKRPVRVVVAGAGAVGVETAAELANFFVESGASHDVHIQLVDGAPDVLARFPKLLRYWVKRRFSHLGIGILCNVMVLKAERSHIVLGPRQTNPGEPPVECSVKKGTELPYDVFIWAGGLKPTPVLHAMELPKTERGQIRVLPTMQVAGHKDVFAIGDIAAYKDAKTGVAAPAAAWVTVQEAHTVAYNITHDVHREFHLQKKFPATVTIGGKRAVASLFGIQFNGIMAFWMRRCIDLNYLRKLLPVSVAFTHWRKSIALFSRNDG